MSENNVLDLTGLNMFTPECLAQLHKWTLEDEEFCEKYTDADETRRDLLAKYVISLTGLFLLQRPDRKSGCASPEANIGLEVIRANDGVDLLHPNLAAYFLGD